MHIPFFLAAPEDFANRGLAVAWQPGCKLIEVEEGGERGSAVVHGAVDCRDWSSVLQL